MDSINKITQKLNQSINNKDFDIEQFKYLINRLLTDYKIKLKWLDFEYFNETRLETIRQEKIKAVNRQNFEGAASLRDREKECINYVEFKQEHNLTHSLFWADDNFLVYCYFGTSQNDKIILPLIMSFQI
jgi:hypothetical protein